jgi:glyoxylase-like metal-dependent hydrolase (beta-lactamase superfamily II)
MTIRVEATADRQFGTNSYLVEDETSHDAVVIDANLEPQPMIDLVRDRDAKVKAILLTHTDIDHVAGLPELLEAFGPIPVAVHDAEREFVARGTPMRSEFGASSNPIENVESLVEGETFQVGSLSFEVLHTPGHSPGGVSLRIGDNLFTGDALFAGSIGRSDFTNSNGRILIEGIVSKLLSQPDHLVVYSGHGPATTIGRERKTNPFLT